MQREAYSRSVLTSEANNWTSFEIGGRIEPWSSFGKKAKNCMQVVVCVYRRRGFFE